MAAARLNCYVCDERFNVRQMVRIHGDERADVRRIAVAHRLGFGRPELNIEEGTRVCFNCHRNIRRELELPQANQITLRLNVLRQMNNNACMICNNRNDIRRLSVESKVDVYIQCDIFLPERTLCCNIHLDERGYILRVWLNGLQCINRPCIINEQYFQSFLQQLRIAPKNKLNLADIHELSDEETCVLTSLTKQQFNELYTFCDPVPVPGGHRYVYRKDLLMFLCKLRQGVSDEFLTILFNYSSRQATSMAVDTVRESLNGRFVNNSVGFGAINREQYIEQHVTEFSNRLYNPNPNNPVAIAYIDGKYTYCFKSSNFRALRQTFCRHKGRHLIKPALIVAPDGYILDIHGPYFSDARNNDAAILRNEFENNELLNEWFREGDVVIVDRGYRDVVDLLENFGLNCIMPPLLEQGENQLSTEDANESRKITKTRWIVEARNGHIKTMFKLLQQVQQIHVLPKIGDYYRIAAGIINRYHPVILMEGATDEMAQQLLRRSLHVNHVMNRVIDENLDLRNAQRWVRLDAAELADFPVLTIEFLRALTAGVYQVELAPSYIQDKFQREQTEIFSVEMLRDFNRIPEPGFLRIKIPSRHRVQGRYNLWIHYEPNANVNGEPIRGYYCECMAGARTLGTCAHIASVLWYLGYARHQENVRYPSHRLINEIEDADNRPEQENPPLI